MGNNPEFTSELLRINGLLQTSITELRYRCEVYRLSLKSICKTLANVRKEQGGRLQCLTTCRPSYQAYLLNLSQKQALDRIGIVVRKASTFINGYALVDKRLFQPPPPKPAPVRRNKKRVAFCTTPTVAKTTEPITNDLEEGQIEESEATRGGLLLEADSGSSHGNRKAEHTEVSRKKRAFSDRSAGEKRKTRERGKNSSKEKSAVSSLSYTKAEVGSQRRDQIRNVSRPRNKESGRERCNGNKSLRFSTLNEKGEKQKKEGSKSITCHRFQVINPRYENKSGSRTILSTAEGGRRAGSSAQNRSRAGEKSRNLEGKTSTYHRTNKDSTSKRKEVRRRPSKELCRRESGSHRNERQDERKSSAARERLKDIQSRKSTAKTTRYKVRESLAMVRHHRRGGDSSANATQGQGVARKYLFPVNNKWHNNFKLNRNRVGNGTMPRRPLSKGGDGEGKNAVHSDMQSESKNKSSFLSPRNLSFS